MLDDRATRLASIANQRLCALRDSVQHHVGRDQPTIEDATQALWLDIGALRRHLPLYARLLSNLISHFGSHAQDGISGAATDVCHCPTDSLQLPRSGIYLRTEGHGRSSRCGHIRPWSWGACP